MSKRVESVQSLARVIEGLRSLGKKIVLAVGGFENLRPNDIRFLDDARTRADYLVVGINPKWPQIKGRKLPGSRVPGKDRAEVVAGLRAVDYVTIFEGENAAALLNLLKPDFLAQSHRGGESAVADRKLAQSLNIEVLICGGDSRPSKAPTTGRLLLTRKGR